MTVSVIQYLVKATPDDIAYHPVGFIQAWWPGADASRTPVPRGWLLCDGTFVNREDYPELADLMKPRWKWAHRKLLWYWFVQAKFRVPNMVTIGVDWGVMP